MAKSVGETNSSMTFLMYAEDSAKETYKLLHDITDFPDMGGEPEALEVTNLTDRQKRFIPGIKENGALTFNASYTYDGYKKLAELEDKVGHYAVWFGGSVEGTTVTPTGDDGKFAFDGRLTVRVSGAGTNEVRKMSITIMPETEIAFS